MPVSVNTIVADPFGFHFFVEKLGNNCHLSFGDLRFFWVLVKIQVFQRTLLAKGED